VRVLQRPAQTPVSEILSRAVIRANPFMTTIGEYANVDGQEDASTNGRREWEGSEIASGSPHSLNDYDNLIATLRAAC
jgi:hypothetical protein